jgi:hypothetical protein
MTLYVVALTDDYAVDLQTDGDKIVYIDSSSSQDLTLTLPDCSENDNLRYHCYNNSGNSHNFIIIPFESQSIVGGIDNQLTLTNGTAVGLISYAGQWFAV